jgi:hypothetical protein
MREGVRGMDGRGGRRDECGEGGWSAVQNDEMM